MPSRGAGRELARRPVRRVSAWWRALEEFVARLVTDLLKRVR